MTLNRQPYVRFAALTAAVLIWSSGCSSTADDVADSTTEATSEPTTVVSVDESPTTDAPEPSTTPPAAEPIEVVTLANAPGGTIQGTESENGTIEFLGIPFAEPPINELRFQPPVPAEPLTDVLIADSFGDACVQSAGPESSYAANSEDCLHLNIWTPGVDDLARPVMVWIHGGGWIAEGTAGPLYQGDLLAERGDVVVVSVEYRMGIFGFPYFDGIEGGEEFAGSGNLGLLDQQLGLEWVRDNIAAFGGDPDSVTLFGESAGAMSVIHHLAMPTSEGLFHRAIAQSGAGNTVRSDEYAAEVARRHLDLAGVSTPAEFAALSTEEIFATQEAIEQAEFPVDLVYGPVQDGLVLPEYSHHAIEAGAGSDIALLHGTTHNETTLYNRLLPGLEEIELTTIAELIPYLNSSIPEGLTSQDVADFYADSRAGEPEGLILHAFGTDAFFRMGAVRVSEARQSASAPTYLYRFDWEPPMPFDPGIEFGSPHGAELAFVFGHPEGWASLYDDTVPEALVEQVMDVWTTFARTGNPNGAGTPAWDAYDLDQRWTMLLDSTETATTSTNSADPDGAEREFWVAVPFDGVTPAQS